jgi:cobalt-zinc-cadmium efflux system outer membrane protein
MGRLPAALGLGFALLGPASEASSQAQPPAAGDPFPVIERLTFEQAVARATIRNPSVGEAAQAILRAEALLSQARSVFLPLAYGNVATAVLDAARGFDGSIVQPKTQTAFSATASYSVLNAAGWAAKNQAGDRVGTARASAEETRRNVATSAAQAYLAVIAAERQGEITLRNRDTAQALEEYSRARLEAGQGSRLNHVRSVQQLATAEGLRQLAELLVRRAQEALGVVVFASGPVGANGEPVFPPAPPPGDDSWLAARPDIRLLTAELAAADRVVSDAWKNWLPTVTASFTPRYVTPAGLFEPSKSWRAFFALDVPIFDATLRPDKRVRIADRDTARLRLDALTLQARSELRVAQESVRSTELIVASVRQAADNAAEALRITEIAYRAGATTNIEVVQAQQAARQTEIEAAVAEDRLRQARLDLLVSLGQFP